MAEQELRNLVEVASLVAPSEKPFLVKQVEHTLVVDLEEGKLEGHQLVAASEVDFEDPF